MKRVSLSRVFLVSMVALLIAAAGLPFMSGCAKEEVALPPIKLGLINTYVGAAAAYTVPGRNMWNLILSEVNEAGGVLGRKLELVVRDNKGKVDTTLRNCTELVMDEEVDFLVGGILSSCALAASEFAKENEILYFATMAASSSITGEKGHRYVACAGSISSIQCPAVAEVASQKPWTKYWIVGEDYEYGHAMVDDFWNALKKFKPEVELVGESWVKIGEVDYSAEISIILAAKPDAVYAAEGALGIIPFIKQAKLHGLAERIPIVMLHAIDYGTCVALGEDMPPGILSATSHLISYPDTAENKDYIKKYYDSVGDYPSPECINTYCTAHFLIEAIKKAGTVETEAVIDALKGLTISTPIGTQTLRAYDQQVMTPTFVGVTYKDPGYPFFIAKDVSVVPAEEVAPSVDEIKKLRGE